MPEFDLDQLIYDLGVTAEKLSDGSVDEGDLVVLDNLKRFLEQAAAGTLDEYLAKPAVKLGLAAIAMFLKGYGSEVFKLIDGMVD
jgi:hypothetical protein